MDKQPHGYFWRAGTFFICQNKHLANFNFEESHRRARRRRAPHATPQPQRDMEILLASAHGSTGAHAEARSRLRRRIAGFLARRWDDQLTFFPHFYDHLTRIVVQRWALD